MTLVVVELQLQASVSEIHRKQAGSDVRVHFSESRSRETRRRLFISAPLAEHATTLAD